MPFKNEISRLKAYYLQNWFSITLTFLTPIFFILGIYYFSGSSKNNSRVRNSVFLGREIEIAPFAILAKMENWGGWTDKYLHLFAELPNSDDISAKIVSTNKLNKFTKFKVIDVRYKFKEMGYEEICILENKEKSGEKISVRCENLPSIEEVTRASKEGEAEIGKYGNAYIALLNLKDDKFQAAFSVNNIRVYKIDSKEKLIDILKLSHSSPEYFYDHIAWKRPMVLKDRNHFHEEKFTLAFLDNNSYILSYRTNETEKNFEEVTLKYKIRDDVNHWINEYYRNSLFNRWALRLIALKYQETIASYDTIKKFEDSSDQRNPGSNFLAVQAMSNLQNVINCILTHSPGKGVSERDISKLNRIFFNTEDLKSKLLYIQKLNKPVSNIGKDFTKYCYEFSPPEVYGDGKIITIYGDEIFPLTLSKKY